MNKKTENLDVHLKQALEQVSSGGRAADKVCKELFTLGYDLERQGNREAADSLYQQAIELIEDLKAQADTSLSDHSVARLAFQHGKSLLQFGKPRSAIAALRRSLEAVETSLGCSTNGVLLELQGMILGWLAIAQRRAMKHEEAVESYQRAISIWRKLPDMIGAPVTPYSGFLGACLIGVAKSYDKLNLTHEAELSRAEGQELLEKEFEANSGPLQ